MEQEVNSLSVQPNQFVKNLKLHWKKWLTIFVVVAALIFLLYPRAYSYELEDTCESKSGVVSVQDA